MQNLDILIAPLQIWFLLSKIGVLRQEIGSILQFLLQILVGVDNIFTFLLSLYLIWQRWSYFCRRGLQRI